MKSLTRLSVAAFIVLAACTPDSQDGGTASPVAIGPSTLNVADAAIAGGDPGMALSVSQSILATDPHNVDAMVHEGDAYYALDRCIPAQAAYQLALQTDPRSTAAETGLGRCLLKTNPQLADAALQAAVQDDPGNAAAYNDLGIARDLEGNFAGAVDPYQHALAVDPALTAAEVNLGLSLALSGNGAEALQYLGPLATGPGATPKIREDYAAALMASGREPEARAVLAIDLPPDQVNSAVDGFSAVIAGAQPPLQPAVAAAPTVNPAVETASVDATPLPGSPPPPAPSAPMAAMPPDTAPAATYTPDNSTAAYTGPSPLPVTASSSTPGPGAPPPTSAAATDFTTAETAKTPPPAATPAAAPAASPAVADTDADSSGTYKVQLASLNSQSDAQREWAKVSGALPALFSAMQPDIETATVNGHTYYRLRTGNFSTKADAAKFCGEVSAGGTTCTLANF